MASIAEANSLFEIDMELDSLLEQIQEQVESGGEPSEGLVPIPPVLRRARGKKWTESGALFE